jgi:CelD/BcsL family acetyltransferase involved in cellulose biosynthesis
VFSADTAVERLVFQLQQTGCQVARRAGPQCWRVRLPDTWEEYVGRFTKARRKWVRRIERRMMANTNIRFWRPNGRDEFFVAYRHLVRLHQLRWESLGAPGCFASERFSEFLGSAFHSLWQENRVHLTCLELTGQTIAVQADLVGDATVFSYQGGVDPAQLACEPGHLLHVYTIRNAIEAGLEAFDFLRGDEPYKSSWQATPRQCSYLRIASPQSVAQLRHQAWLAGAAMKDWIKDGLSWAGLAPCVGDTQ